MRFHNYIVIAWLLIGAGYALILDNVIASLLCFVICQLLHIEKAIKTTRQDKTRQNPRAIPILEVVIGDSPNGLEEMLEEDNI